MFLKISSIFRSLLFSFNLVLEKLIKIDVLQPVNNDDGKDDDDVVDGKVDGNSGNWQLPLKGRYSNCNNYNYYCCY